MQSDKLSTALQHKMLSKLKVCQPNFIEEMQFEQMSIMKKILLSHEKIILFCKLLTFDFIFDAIIKHIHINYMIQSKLIESWCMRYNKKGYSWIFFCHLNPVSPNMFEEDIIICAIDLYKVMKD